MSALIILAGYTVLLIGEVALVAATIEMGGEFLASPAGEAPRVIDTKTLHRINNHKGE